MQCEFFFESNSPVILALCKTQLGELWMGCPSLIRKISVTYMCVLSVYVKERLTFARDLYLENSADSYLCFQLDLLYSVPYFFFLHRSLSVSLCVVLVELRDLVNPVLTFVSQMALLRCLTFLLESLTVTLTVLLFEIHFFLLTLVFPLQWLSLHWEILIKMLSQPSFTFC